MNISDSSAWLGMNHTLSGLKRNSRGMSEAADAIRVDSQAVLNNERSLPVDRVSVRQAPEMEDAMVDMKLNQHGYSANLKATKISDEALGSLMDMVLPHQKGGPGSR